MPHMDIGERDFSFTISAGEHVLDHIAVENEVVQNPPLAVCYFPLNKLREAKGIFFVDNEKIVVSSIYKKAGVEGTIYRIYNASDSGEEVVMRFGTENCEIADSFNAFEVKTFIYDGKEVKNSRLIING